MKGYPVRTIEVDTTHEGQRLDNFLSTQLKGLPKSAVYRLIRRGEIRVNRKRATPMQKLLLGDQVRLPPVTLPEISVPALNYPLLQRLLASILYEDEHILVINKPSGIAVHGGSEIEFGLVETLQQHPPYAGIQLGHRLDRDTSGCLILAKNRASLLTIHNMMRRGEIQKEYVALVEGNWPKNLTRIEQPLQKYQYGDEFRVRIHSEGKPALTTFSVLESFKAATLLAVRLHTGRMHQIRVHCLSVGHPILHDEKYGAPETLQLWHKAGLKRMFLHAKHLNFNLPHLKEPLAIEAPLTDDLAHFISHFRKL